MGTPVTRSDSPFAMRHIDLYYEPADSEQSALQLIYTLLPDWKQTEGQVQLIRFTDGITNTLLKAVKKRPNASQHEIDQEAVLLRAYGKGTDIIIDREKETLSHSLLANLNLAPPLLARFNNGLLYKYIEGDVCTPEDLRKPTIYRAVAARLAQWHSTLPISAISTVADGKEPAHEASCNGSAKPTKSEQHRASSSQPVPNLWTTMQSWIDALPVGTEEERARKGQLQSECADLSSELGTLPGLDGNDYVFSHCDLLSGNVIIEPESAKAASNASQDNLSVSFIDYEYATPAPAAFDIANHFAEWGGFDCDPSQLPTTSQRRDFLKYYLQSYRTFAPATSNDHFEEELDQLTNQVDLCRGLPGIYWGIWGLIQATISQIDFDYATYAEVRLGEYYGWKAEHDGSRKQAGEELSVRERRWAEE